MLQLEKLLGGLRRGKRKLVSQMLWLCWIGALLGLQGRPSFAFIHEFRRSLAEEALSETVPFTFSPNHFAAEDFSVVGPPVSGVRARLGRESFEWVRVSEVFLLPRGRFLIELGPEVGAFESARIRNFGTIQPLAQDQDGYWRGEIPVALLSEKSNTIHLDLRTNQNEVRTLDFRIKFTPRDNVKGERVLVDPSCSPADVQLKVQHLREDQFVYVGCRSVVSQGDEHPISTLETFLYWEGVQAQRVSVDRFGTEPKVPQVWAFRLQSAPGILHFSEKNDPVGSSNPADGGASAFNLTYRIPKRLRFGSLGVGLGPYAYTYDAPGVAANTYVPLLTFYMSYFYSETLRIAAFNATAPHAAGFSDTGFYVVTEQFNVFDHRYFMRVLLGLNGVAYRANGATYFSFGGPQGFELTITDFAGKRRNLALGAFIYPLINRRSYNNIWLRWGSPAVFGELNFINWQYPLGDNESDGRAYMRSLGISIGFPLTRFL